jgi:hypothetical protein
MEPLDFFIDTSSLPLYSKKIVPDHLDLEKYPKNIPKNYVNFWSLGMNLAVKTNFIDKKII